MIGVSMRVTPNRTRIRHGWKGGNDHFRDDPADRLRTDLFLDDGVVR